MAEGDHRFRKNLDRGDWDKLFRDLLDLQEQVNRLSALVETQQTLLTAHQVVLNDHESRLVGGGL